MNLSVFLPGMQNKPQPAFVVEEGESYSACASAKGNQTANAVTTRRLRVTPARHPPRRRRDGIAWERGRPARILSLWPPLSFSAMLQAATLWAGTAAAKPKESHGAVPG